MTPYQSQPGSPYPAGAKPDNGGVNFSIFSRHATWVELLLYEKGDSTTPLQVIRLTPDINRTFFFWHVYVEQLTPGIHYTWRVDGPREGANATPQSGFRFDADKELLDPWARAVNQQLWDRKQVSAPGETRASSLRAIVVDESDYDWEGDQPLNHAMEHSIIYELHVGGFTRHSSSQVANPGSFAAVIEKIPYLQALGVTDVELMPVMAFDEQDVPEGVAARGLSNYWGYSTHSFFSPHPGYCISPYKGTQLREFRDMVKALHRAGIGVIMDVVLNHTAEGGVGGPTINFKGLANEVFYHLDFQDRSHYRDYTGCGNTVNCNHPLVARFLLGCLEYWVREMHVDGFRFDLASVLARGEDGAPLYHAPLPWSIEFSNTLMNTRLIAEAWDAGGLYQVGDFPGFRWAEWNGQYRDVMRRFVRGDKGLIGEIATRLCGSSDLYQASGRLPINSINFITCHDGFTLYDLVSYNDKHNAANGEDNRDGCNHNLSWNNGVEGQSDDPGVLSLRQQQTKNFMALLFLSQGVPMILSGDEVLRTQRGNNNGYCQDNELSWFDWNLVEQNRDMLRFVQRIIAFRKRHPCLIRKRYLTGHQPEAARFPDISWHGVQLHEPLWHDPNAQQLAYTLGALNDEEADLHIMLNMSVDDVHMQLPPLAGRAWCKTIDTNQTSPGDILEPHEQSPLAAPGYRVPAHSIVVFESRPH